MSECLPSSGVLQPAGGVSQIQFGGEDCITPKMPTSVPEVAKQKELSGSTETTLDLKHRSFSNAKAKELVGSNIFGPAPPDAPARRVAMEVREQHPEVQGEVPRNVRTSVKVSNVSPCVSLSFVFRVNLKWMDQLRTRPCCLSEVVCLSQAGATSARLDSSSLTPIGLE